MIGVYLLILILFLVTVFLYFTKRLGYIFKFEWKSLKRSLNNVQKWFLSGSIIAGFILGFFTNWVSSFTYGYIFPSPDKTIIENTEKIIEKQDRSINIITESNEKLSEVLKKSKIDSRDIEQYLKELPLDKGKGETESVINEWYQKRKISADVKELLFVIVSAVFEHSKDLSNEIANLKVNGKTDIAELLENVQKHLLEGDANKIKDDFFSRKEKLKRENIIVLQQSIKATEALFAFKETKELYQELILLEPTAEIYFRFAYFLYNFRYFTDASNYYIKALKIYRELDKETPKTNWPNIAAILSNLAVIQNAKNEFPQAQEKFEEALKIYRELAKEDAKTYLHLLAGILSNFAYLQIDKNEYLQAQEKFEEALKILRELAKENPKTYLPDYAITLNNLAILYQRKHEYPKALEKHEEALNIYQELVKENPRAYLYGMASTLIYLAVLQQDKNELPQAQKRVEEALKIFRELGKENPKTYLPDVAGTLNNLGGLRKYKNEFSQACENYEEALKIFRELDRETPKIYLSSVAMNLNNLAIIHSVINKFSLAINEFEEALKIRRELAKENPKVYLPDVAMTLSNLAYLRATKNELPYALKEYEEALKIYRELAKENPKTYDIDYAQTLILGVYALKKDKSNLKIAKNILEKYSNVYQAQKQLDILKGLE